ncbi:MAG TPA: PQQ-dependent sugar dehydrogenase [Rhizomicrobium sp.]|jgi:glucose/arabinose dehydrogenase
MRAPLALFALVLTSGTALAADTVGQKFSISPNDLPKPHATPSASMSSEPVGRPKGAGPKVPDGFTATLFASGLTDPRFMAVAPNGDVFVTEPDAGKITVLRDSSNDGKADKRTTYASGFDRVHGIAFHDGALYVADVKAVWKLPYKDGALTVSGKPQRVTQDDFGGSGGHFTRDIVFGPDGTLYLAIGSIENVDDHEPRTRAMVNTVDVQGHLHMFGYGTRNPVGVAFYPGTNDLYITVNERDTLGDDLVPDYLTHLAKGDFYGWPYAYTGTHPDPDFGAKRPDLVAKSKTPDVLFESHSAPLGVVFYEGTQFPASYKGDAFVALHGSWNRGNPTGYKVVRVHFTNGKPENAYENFAVGFWDGASKPAKVWGRPAGLAVAKDGSLLISDDSGKAVWRVSYKGK